MAATAFGKVGFSRCCTRCSLSRPTKVSPHHSPTTGCSTNLPFKSISSSAVRITGGDSWTSRGSPETFTTPATPSVDWLLHRLLQALKSRDFYHTCYTLSGLALAQIFASPGVLKTSVLGDPFNLVEPTHPVYNICVKSAANAARHFDRLEVPSF